MPLSTHPATPDDAERIAALHADSWRRNNDAYLDDEVVDDFRSLWQKRLSAPAPNQFVLLAELDTAFAGFICAYAEDDSAFGSLIDNLHVDYQYRRLGAGRTLMREAAAWLGEHHADAGVYLWVLEKNDNARRFYERLGARDEGAVIRDVRGGGTASVCRYVWETPAALLAECRADRRSDS